MKNLACKAFLFIQNNYKSVMSLWTIFMYFQPADPRNFRSFKFFDRILKRSKQKVECQDTMFA